MSIKAHYRQEERYIGVNITYVDDSDKVKILDAIAANKTKYGVNPSVFESKKDDGTGGIYVEFNDDYDKDAGDFYEAVLKEIGVEKCECDDI
jgi:hypothetical protein